MFNILTAHSKYLVGVEHFHLMMAQGSNANSMFLYPKTKGEVENFVQDLGFSKLTIYQPGLLLCPREESRPGEFLFQKVTWLNPLDPIG